MIAFILYLICKKPIFVRWYLLGMIYWYIRTVFSVVDYNICDEPNPKANWNIHQADELLGNVWEQIFREKSFDIGGWIAYWGFPLTARCELCVAVPNGERLSVKHK